MGLIGTNSNDEKEETLERANTANLEITEENKEEILNDFLDWVNDKSLVEKCRHLDVIGKNEAIVQLYVYKGRELDLYDGQGNKIRETKVFPYAKVLKASDILTNDYNIQNISSGAILKANANLDRVKFTDEWLAWESRQNKGKNYEHEPEPQKFVGDLVFWENDKYCLDPFAIDNPDFLYVKHLQNFQTCGF